MECELIRLDMIRTDQTNDYFELTIIFQGLVRKPPGTSWGENLLPNTINFQVITFSNFKRMACH